MSRAAPCLERQPEWREDPRMTDLRNAKSAHYLERGERSRFTCPMASDHRLKFSRKRHRIACHARLTRSSTDATTNPSTSGSGPPLRRTFPSSACGFAGVGRLEDRRARSARANEGNARIFHADLDLAGGEFENLG